MSGRFSVIPGKEVFGIPFGTDRSLVREKLGDGFREFRKTSLSRNTSDDYGLFHIYYNERNALSAVEFFPEAEIDVAGTAIPREYAAFSEWLKALDPSAREDGDGMISIHKSVGVYAPDGMIESILFGDADYYS